MLVDLGMEVLLVMVADSAYTSVSLAQIRKDIRTSSDSHLQIAHLGRSTAYRGRIPFHHETVRLPSDLHPFDRVHPDFVQAECRDDCKGDQAKVTFGHSGRD